jgi:hypothetical protein
MNGKVAWFQHITVRPARPGPGRAGEPVEGQMVGLGNSLSNFDNLSARSFYQR